MVELLTSTPEQRPGKSAFTLLEVMFSIGLVTVILLTLIGLTTSAIRSGKCVPTAAP